MGGCRDILGRPEAALLQSWLPSTVLLAPTPVFSSQSVDSDVGTDSLSGLVFFGLLHNSKMATILQNILLMWCGGDGHLSLPCPHLPKHALFGSKKGHQSLICCERFQGPPCPMSQTPLPSAAPNSPHGQDQGHHFRPAWGFPAGKAFLWLLLGQHDIRPEVSLSTCFLSCF